MSWTPVLAFYGVCFLLFLSLLAGLWNHDALLPWLRGFRSVPRSGWIVAAVWFIVAIGSLTDLSFQHRLYLSMTDVDHLTRAAITGAITRDGVRPPNPFYDLGSLSPLRYHYFWFILCGFVKLLSGSFVSSQQAMTASVVWCGWALFAVVPLFLRFFEEVTGATLRRCSLIAVCLFAVTGLDLLPNALHTAVSLRVYPDMEWWNEQVASWFGSLLWVPHHVAGLITSLTGFLVLWNAALSRNPRRYLAAGVLRQSATIRRGNRHVNLCDVGLCLYSDRLGRHHNIAALVEPYHRPAYSRRRFPGAGAALSSFPSCRLRDRSPQRRIFRELRRSPVCSDRYSGRQTKACSAAPLVAAACHAACELFYGTRFLRRGRGPVPVGGAEIEEGGQAAARSGRRTPSQWQRSSVTACTFLRSGVIAANDLGWRGFLPAQFIMLLWAADLMVQRGSRSLAQGKGFHNWWLRSPAWAVLLLVGLGGTVYDVILLRTYLVATDFGLVTGVPTYAPDRQFGERAWDLSSAPVRLPRSLPACPVQRYNRARAPAF